jgi:G3E family GTPase
MTPPLAAATPPWPVALLTGLLGSGKTTLVRALLTRDGMADTMVVVNEFGAVGIDHELIAAVHGDVVLLRGGCLCCGVRQDLARTLRDLHLRWRGGAIPDFARVVIETSGLADPGPVVATLGSHPLVQDAYVLRSITTLVDAEHGRRQLAAQPVGWRQVAAADRVLISKPDRVGTSERFALSRQLRTVNPVASVGTSLFGDADVGACFAPASWQAPSRRRAAAIEVTGAHTRMIRCMTLECDRPLDWTRLRDWLAGLLDKDGDGLLRLKGILDIAGYDRPLVLQAVHHTVYPTELLAAWRGDPMSRLVLIADRALGAGLEAGFQTCAAR